MRSVWLDRVGVLDNFIVEMRTSTLSSTAVIIIDCIHINDGVDDSGIPL